MWYKSKNIIKIIVVIVVLILVSSFFFVNNRDIFNINNNMTIELKDGKKKETYIDEEDLRIKIDILMKKIAQKYSKAKINQVNEIKFLYNYKEKMIEYTFLSVNLDRYYVTTMSNGSKFSFASVEASISRNGVYSDNRKEKNGDNVLIFNVNNLSADCGVLTQENNEVLVQIKNKLNEGRDNTFYWREKVYY